MRIKSLKVENFIGISCLHIDDMQDLTFVAGPNKVGKTSLAQAINLALRGLPERVQLKKNFGELVYDGAEAAEIVVDLGDRQQAVRIRARDGKSDGLPNPESMSESLNCALDQFSFANLDGKDRRRLLSMLGGVKADKKTVLDLIAKGGGDLVRAAKLENLLLAGFDAAAKAAADHASDARRDWERITKERYGKDKAESFAVKADVEVTDVTHVSTLRLQQQQLSNDITTLDRAITVYQSNLCQRAALEKQLIGEVEVERLPNLTKQAEAVSESLEGFYQRMEALNVVIRAASGEQPSLCCPACGVSLVLDEENYRLEEWQQEPVDAAELAAAREELTVLENKITEKNRILDRAASDIAVIKQYQKVKEKLDKLAAAEPLDLDDAQGQLSQLRNDQEELSSRLHEISRQEGVIRQAEQTTEQAKTLHLDVVEWTRLRDLLSPDGIPALFLEKTLGPLTLCLQEMSGFSGWPLVEINKDMVITYGGRAYDLCSESEQWRASAMLSAAVSYLSGVNFLLLDRADVLDVPSRAELYKWLVALKGKSMQSIVCYTAKEQPSGIADAAVVWLGK